MSHSTSSWSFYSSFPSQLKFGMIYQWTSSHTYLLQGNTPNLAVVDHLSKSQRLTAFSVAESFAKMVCKLHVIPGSTVLDCDLIFTSKFWQGLFKISGTILSMSSSHHHQTDGQTEPVNKGLQQYLRCFVHSCPNRWGIYLYWAEWFITPHNILPPILHLVKWSVGDHHHPFLSIPRHFQFEAIEYDLTNRDRILRELKHNLSKAQLKWSFKLMLGGRMWNLNNEIRFRFVYNPIDNIFKANRSSHKLSKRYHGIFQMKRISAVAYKLAIPANSKIQFYGDSMQPQLPLPSLSLRNKLVINSLAIIGQLTADTDGISTLKSLSNRKACHKKTPHRKR